ncbi:hydrolase [Actinomadura harenae]|uniref:Hydrolase n=2 Tax=Actinomadura harenae TaxID=2483351 RepID=A0A3M2LHD8_9ACTN|nr:hydrolase [Actinomadura harenae]
MSSQSRKGSLVTVMEFVDAHVHHWQTSVHDWYPMLHVTLPEVPRDYPPSRFRADAEAAGVRLLGTVHVSATTVPGAFLDETRWLDAMDAPDRPSAIIGSVDPDVAPHVVEAQLDEQARSPLFRGVRVFAGLSPDGDTAAALLRELGERGLVFDQVIRAPEVDAYLAALAGAPDVQVVLEHAGWPETGSPEGFIDWRRGLAKLAALPRVDCKISGLGMPLGRLDAAALRPYVETCLDLFGIDRCFFGSNFPVDGLSGGLAELMAAYQDVTSDLSAEERRKLFVGNATRRYRLN